MSTLNEHDIDRIQDYIDGELPDDEMRAVADRLNRDADWRAEEERLRALIRRAQSLSSEVDPGRDLWRGIERRIAATPADNVVTFSRRTVYVAGTAAAALLVVAALSFATLNQNQPDESDSPRLANGSTQTNPNVQFATYEAPENAQYELAIAQYKSATDALHEAPTAAVETTCPTGALPPRRYWLKEMARSMSGRGDDIHPRKRSPVDPL